MWGRPIRRSARQGPLSGSAGSLFSARSGRKTAPAPPAVCALSAAAARLLRPEQRAATARRAPDACQLSATADLGRRKYVIFRLGQLLELNPVRRATESHTPATPHSAHQVLCRDRAARSHQVLWLQFLAAMAIPMHVGEIFVSGGIRKVTHWPSSRRLWRCSEAGRSPTSAARPARPAAL